MYQLFLLCATCVGCVGAAALCRRQEGRSDLRSRCGAPNWSAPAIHLKQTYEGSEDEDNDDIVNEVNKGFISSVRSSNGYHGLIEIRSAAAAAAATHFFRFFKFFRF